MRRIPAVLAVLALTACSGTDAAPASSPPGTAPSSVPAGAGLLDVTDCGVFTLRQGEDLPDHAGRCLVDAVRTGNPARLRVTRPSTEGTMIPMAYAAGADGRVRVVTDTRHDNWGERAVTTQICTGPRWADGRLTFARCTEPAPSPS